MLKARKGRVLGLSGPTCRTSRRTRIARVPRVSKFCILENIIRFVVEKDANMPFRLGLQPLHGCGILERF